MATYKVIQDIEAEDHILGPLTLKQFIYGLVCVFFLYISFVCISKHLDWLLLIFLPPAIMAGFLAFPFVRDQPTEIWALAKIRFLFIPRLRIWSQNSTKDHVIITAPKKTEHNYSDGLSQTEVKSRLQALANIIDSRGWAMKNVNPNTMYPVSLIEPDKNSDRLIDPLDMPKPVPDYDLTPTDDIMDDLNNPVAQQFNQMITASTKSHRDKLLRSLNNIRGQLHQTQTQAGTINTSNPIQGSSDAGLVQQANMGTPQPNNHSNQQQPNNPTTNQTTPPPDNAILNLAKNNDRNVASLAREAKKIKDSGDEVVISLH